MSNFVCLNCKGIIGNFLPIEESVCGCGSTDLMEIKDIGTTEIMRTLYFIVGPTGAGKNHILKSLPSKLENIPSITTRKPRPNEVHGVDYYFIGKEEMTDLQNKDKLCEQICFGGEIYGVHSDILIDKLFHSPKNLSIIVEPVGLEQMLKYIEKNHSIFKFNNFDIEILFLDIPRQVRFINMLSEAGINEMNLFDFYKFYQNPSDICDGELHHKFLDIDKVLTRLVRNGDSISASMTDFISNNKQRILKLSNDIKIYINIRTLRTKKEIDNFIEEVAIGSLKLQLDKILNESDLDQLKIIEQILYKKIMKIESGKIQCEEVKCQQ